MLEKAGGRRMKLLMAVIALKEEKEERKIVNVRSRREIWSLIV